MGEENPQITCRGRNGWFKMAEYQVVTANRAARINIRSSRKGTTSPIIIIGDKHEVIKMMKDIIRRLEAQQCNIT